jgi:hypothetical protein
VKQLRNATLLVALVFSLRAGSAFADTRTRSATTGTDDASTGTIAWSPATLPAYALLSDGVSFSLTTHYLVLGGFGFTLPPTAIIDGIQLSMQRTGVPAFSTGTRDSSVVIVKGGALGTDEHSSGVVWNIVPGLPNVFGSAADLWGETWTPADINSATFGAAVSAMASIDVSAPFVLSSATVSSATITVTYYLPCPATLDNTGCDTSFTKASLKVDESKPGNEKLQASLGGGAMLAQSAIGDLASVGGPGQSICIYGSDNALATTVATSAGGTCGTAPCWKSAGGAYPDGRGFSYKDKAGATQGITQIKLAAGAAVGKTKASFKGSGKAGPLPLGTAAALDGDMSASVQIRDPNGLCLSATLPTVSKNSDGKFAAKK